MRRPREKGFAYVMAMILIVTFATLAMAFVSASDLNLRISTNSQATRRAQHAGESGIVFALQQFRCFTLPSTTIPDNLATNLYPVLSTQLNGSANLSGAVVTGDASFVHVPPINTGSESFEMAVGLHGDGKGYLDVTGHADKASRQVSMQLTLVAPTNSAFDYGVASKGTVNVSGNAEIRGKNALTEASVISTTPNPLAISVSGGAVIDGDLSCVGSKTSIAISGNPTVAGSQDMDQIAQHVHFGVDPPVFPELDTSIFRALATGGVIDKSTNTSKKDAVFNNVVIKAGTNPTFSSDVTLNGVVYIEAPNIVTFTSKVTINGLVATDKATSPLTSCKLNFAGSVEAFGVEALPDNDARFTAVKQLPGTFIAAEGFDVSFAGQFTTINGTIAASKLTFSGQAAGTVKGSVLGLANNDTSISGTVDIIIDRSNSGHIPPGFRMPVRLQAVPASYVEAGI